MEDILTTYSKYFEEFVSIDGIREFGITIPRKILKNTTWHDFVHVPKHIRTKSNKRSQPLFYKIRGYSFEEVQKMNTLTVGNACHYTFWTLRNFEQSYAMSLARSAWDEWRVVAPSNMLNFLSKNNAKSIDYWTARGHSEDVARTKVSSIIANNRSARTIIYWVEKGFSEDDARQKVSEFQSMSAKRSVEASKRNGTMHLRRTTSIDHWLRKGYSFEDAKKLQSERQTTFSLKKCIEKYGEILGKQRFDERQAKWQNSLQSKPKHELDDINSRKGSGNLEWALKKTNGDVDAANDILLELNDKKNTWTFEWALKKTNGDVDAARELIVQRKQRLYVYRTSFSKESIVALSPIVDYVRAACPDITPRWKDTEFSLTHDVNCFFYDLTFPELSIIIEYHGWYWHPREGDYEWKNIFGATYETKFPYDKFKKELAISNGFEHLEIWSDEKIDYQHIFEKLDEKIKNLSKKSVLLIGNRHSGN